MTNIAALIGPAIAGALVATIGAADALYVDSASYVLSALGLVLLRRSSPFESRPPRPATSTRHDIAEGMRFVWRHRVLRSLTLVGFGNSFANGGVVGLVVVFGARALHLHTGDGRVAWLFVAVTAGGLAASLSVTRIARRLRIGVITLGGLTGGLVT